ncbi:hypothetical protein [Bradyrhizobium sp. CB3481]|uniref:hypothetical protein n=1 Tax=Bradyrhizobium sp. CB3481 TaxID=3039158 RepID=UPI0024B1ABA5|nr:hypothetical protein [Bradyrhizobium sp. CB3481]WFU14365.1 hypothetical protein QA643_24560 [Bradyrhizobium sp. CB3481]
MAPSQRFDITYQTLHSELVQRSLEESFTSEFSSKGRFVAVEVKGKKYWYFDTPKPEGGGQERRYVGPVDDPEITKKVEAFKDLKADLKKLNELPSAKDAAVSLPRDARGLSAAPVADNRPSGGSIGEVRLVPHEGVLVGTVAYQRYSAVLADGSMRSPCKLATPTLRHSMKSRWASRIPCPHP